MQLQIDPHGRLLPKLLQAIAPNGKCLLEVGWGDGRVTSLLAGRAARLTALDVDVHPACRERNRWHGAEFLAASGEALPFAGPCFDTVLFTQSLHHQNGRRALEEAVRVLRPDGRIVILEPVVGTELENVCGIFQHETERRLEALYAILECGLSLEHREAVQTVWRFKDREALARWLCDYYKVPQSVGLHAEIDRILAEKSRASPLDLSETLLLICLRACL
jgi:SAM-dependent methyltransferase